MQFHVLGHIAFLDWKEGSVAKTLKNKKQKKQAEGSIQSHYQQLSISTYWGFQFVQNN